MTQTAEDTLTNPVPSPSPRPALWRLPLLVAIVLGLAVLKVVDNLLQRDFRSEATTQAVQADALVESILRQRVALLETLSAMVADTRDPVQERSRFMTFARNLPASEPEVQLSYLANVDGTVKDVYPTVGNESLVGASLLHNTAREDALRLALRDRTATSTGTLRLRNGDDGMILFAPIMRNGVVAGFVGSTVAYRSLFTDALAGQLHGRFEYRIVDENGAIIATSTGYPARETAAVSRGVRLPGAHEWRLEVALPMFGPALPRIVLWTIGLVSLALLVALAVREEYRSQRVAAHSLHLELLSQSLLDANVRLEERALQIAEANRAKSRFLANISHELRTPINAIVGYNALALEGIYGDLSADLREVNERVRRSAEHLLALVNDVLDLSKIEVGKMEVDVAPVDLGALIENAVSVVESSASAKDLWLDVVIARDLPHIESDARHLRQIVMNLLSNAIKFTERGSITIVARRMSNAPDSRVIISVEDTGVGIRDSDMGRIFDEFEQVRPSGRGDSLQRGTGLGLTIARKLARLIGGDVTATSRIAVGSRFELVIPQRAPRTHVLTTSPAAPDAVVVRMIDLEATGEPTPPEITAHADTARRADDLDAAPGAG